MSNTDKARLPKITPVLLVPVTECDEMGSYTFFHHVYLNDRRYFHRVERQGKREMAQDGAGIKARLADADTREQIEDVLLSEPYTGPVGTKHTVDMCKGTCTMPSHQKPVERKVQPVVSRKAHLDAYLDRQAQEILRLRLERKRNQREREYNLEREMKNLGFGGRYGILLDD